MKAQDFNEAKLIKTGYYLNDLNEIKNRSEYTNFNMPKNFWFKIYNDRLQIHYAFIVDKNNNIYIFFSNVKGQIFDKLQFKNIKVAKRLLRKNKFVSSSNKKCPYLPITPLYEKIMTGKKTAPYSVGNLWIKQERYKTIEYKKELKRLNQLNLIFFILLVVFIIGTILVKVQFFAS